MSQVIVFTLSFCPSSISWAREHVISNMASKRAKAVKEHLSSLEKD
jgi:hypothetical protein